MFQSQLLSCSMFVCIWENHNFGQQVQPVYVPEHHTWLHGLTMHVCWTRRLHGCQSPEQPCQRNGRVGNRDPWIIQWWLGEWVSVTWHFLFLLLLVSVPTILDSLSIQQKLPVLFWLLQHSTKRHSRCIPVGILIFSLCKVSAVSHPLLSCPAPITCVGHPFRLQWAYVSMTLEWSGLVANTNITLGGDRLWPKS